MRSFIFYSTFCEDLNPYEAFSANGFLFNGKYLVPWRLFMEATAMDPLASILLYSGNGFNICGSSF